jgi:zinc transporter, ZIP family
VSGTEVVILGLIAGSTIFLGLPVGRLRSPAPRLRVALNAGAIGILLFLLWDVLSHAFEPLETALDSAQHHGGSWWRLAGLSAVFVIGLAVGLMGLVYFDLASRRRSRRADRALVGSGAPREPAGPAAPRDFDAYRMALFIALGIGMHNFSEGLAIGQTAARDEVSLALLLVIGFGLHNATEGFGIVAPLAGEATPPTWGFLAAMGVLGGGPTFVGTIVGQAWVNDAVYVVFLTLAAGSILYVVIQLLNVAMRSGYVEILMWGVLAGLLVGFATDMIVTAAGV